MSKYVGSHIGPMFTLTKKTINEWSTWCGCYVSVCVLVVGEDKNNNICLPKLCLDEGQEAKTAEDLQTNIQDLEHKPQSQYKAISMCYVVIYLETTHFRLLL